MALEARSLKGRRRHFILVIFASFCIVVITRESLTAIGNNNFACTRLQLTMDFRIIHDKNTSKTSYRKTAERKQDTDTVDRLQWQRC